jgi:serine/threonine protein kinase
MERGSFGQFTLLDQLWRDVGTLWRARDDAQGGREVALKIFEPGDPPRFINAELYALRMMNHARVCRLLRDGSHEGSRYLVFAPFDGTFLSDLLKIEQHGLDLEVALPIFTGILDGLSYIHGKQVIHRDLKPGNIFVSSDGHALLTNFCCASLKTITLPTPPDSDSRSGEIFGTLTYLSPEVWQGGSEQADARSDLYGFGLMLYEALTGRPPFTGETVAELAQAHLKAEPPSLIAARPGLPQHLEAVYRRLLAKNREERYQSAAEVAAELFNQRSPTTVISRPVFCPYCRSHLTAADADQYECGSCRKNWGAQTIFPCHACGAYTVGSGLYCQFCGVEKTVVAPRRDSEHPVQPAWDEGQLREPSVSSQYSVIPAMHWSAIATQAVFGGASPPPPTPTPAPTGLEATLNSYSAPMAAASPVLTGSPLIERGISESAAAPAASFPERRSGLLVPGMRLMKRYNIINRVGAGGFANVYLAYDELLDEKTAIKVPLHDERQLIEQTFQSQLKPWKFLSDKDPSRVVKLFHAQHVQDREVNAFCIFMEYMSGGSLADMVSKEWHGCPRNPDELAKLMRLFLQSCRAVRFLHAHNALHRDIKPANMLLDAGHSICKLSDFELVDHRKDGASTQALLGGTPIYMAPECADNQFSEASDIYSLGVTLYQLLSGRLPFQVEHFYDKRRAAPPELTKLNPLVSQELQQIVMRCLDFNPEHRPQGVDDLIADLAYIGVSDEETSAAPVNLAHLLLTHLTEDEKTYLTRTLTEDQGFHSASREALRWQADLIQEYCYTASPREVLANNFTSRQLALIADKIGLAEAAGKEREEVIAGILEAMGFLPGPQKIPGIETTRSFLESQLMGLAHATNSDECSGMALSGLAAVERTVDWLVRFYGQLFYGSGFTTFLSRQANGKPWNRMTFGEKAGALRMLCSKRPTLPLPHRLQEVFEWPIIPPKPFDQLDRLVKRRNELAHTMERGGFYDAQRSARQILAVAVEVVAELASNRYIPRVVQIISRQDDVYGRHFYLGRDDRDHSERIFTPLPLSVGRLYLFYPLTNPVCINPLIYPYDTSKQAEAASGKTVSNRRSSRREPERTG